MLNYAALFFLFALIMAVFGFTAIAVGLAAKILFVLFMLVAMGTVLLNVISD